MEPTDSPLSPFKIPTNLAEALDFRRRLGLDVPTPSRMDIRLAIALAERLDAVLPAPFHVRAEDGHVSQIIGDQWIGASDVAGILDQDSSDPLADESELEEWPFVDRVVSISYNILSHVQDWISETTTEPWPRLPQGGMANPGTRATTECLYLWYGPGDSEETAVLSLAPIMLAALERD